MIEHNYIDPRPLLLVHEANRWLGITEVGGDNKGQVVEMFQKAVDGSAVREPWCLAFVQFCVKQVDSLLADLLVSSLPIQKSLPNTEHCLTMWNAMPKELKTSTPELGSLAVWKFGDTDKGHVGIVVEINGDTFKTIEGNTTDGTGLQREGGGVFLKTRSIHKVSGFELQGFVRPWQHQNLQLKISFN